MTETPRPVNPAPIDPDLVQWRDAEEGREGSHLLILMHGYGSHERDLFSLAPMLPDHLTLAALRAPRALQNAMPGGQGFSWFDLLAHNPDPSQIEAAVSGVLEWLDDLPHKFASIGLLGFSQGGVMALQLARTRPETFAYLVQLSGFVYPTPHAGDAALANRQPRLPAFQAWGTHDAVIPPERTQATVDWMAAHLDAEQREYPMPHAVIPEEVDDIVAFLRRVTAE